MNETSLKKKIGLRMSQYFQEQQEKGLPKDKKKELGLIDKFKGIQEENKYMSGDDENEAWSQRSAVTRAPITRAQR
jgi:hypothetical protein